jgi:hypothetical protein
MTLYIDGNKIEEPEAAVIAKGFESIDKSTSFNKGGISLVELSRSKGNSLAVSGHPVEGWLGLVLEADGISRAADVSTPLRQEKIIGIFQSYARGDDLWEKEFQWAVIDSGKLPVKRIVFLVAVIVVILFFGRSCVK